MTRTERTYYVVFGLYNFSWSFIGPFLAHEVGFGVTEPLVQAWTNDHVADDRRATVLSVRAMSWTFGGASGLIVTGLLARAAGLPAAWWVMGTALLVAVPAYLQLGRLARRHRVASVTAVVAADGPGVV